MSDAIDLLRVRRAIERQVLAFWWGVLVGLCVGLVLGWWTR